MPMPVVSPKSGTVAAKAHKTRRAALRALAGASVLAVPTIGAIGESWSRLSAQISASDKWRPAGVDVFAA